MNTLGYRCHDHNGLSFELLVDGQPPGAMVGGRDNAIPYWIIVDDLPHYPPHGEEEDPEIRIVAVCSCGEYGCCHTRCRVTSEGDCVVFHDFDEDVIQDGRRRVFRFARSNYESVVFEVVRLAREHGLTPDQLEHPDERA